MGAFLETILKRASEHTKTIVLPEGSDPRMIQAAATVSRDKIAKLVILGDKREIEKQLKEQSADMSRIKVVDPNTSDQFETYSQLFHEMRKHKGITEEKARVFMQDNIYFGTMMVKQGDADGLVAGAVHSSADTIRPALQIIKARKGVNTVSSMFFMCTPSDTYLYSDCGLNQNPNAEQLADIAFSTAKTAQQFGFTPRIAMLSYSTKGSAGGAGTEKVITATKLTKDKLAGEFEGEYLIDGELQFDAAFVPSVAASKAPESPLEGQANVFIFPDLGAGNICYKVTERLAGADAYGPILQGLAMPVNDLSRGCDADDIVATIAITAIQAQR